MDEEGRIVASLDDYAQVRELIGAVIADGVEASVRPEVREVVEAVAGLLGAGSEEVSQSELARALRLDKSSISRRVAGAVEKGLLRNREDRKGRPARLLLGDPIPDDIEVLPRPERLHNGQNLGSPVSITAKPPIISRRR